MAKLKVTKIKNNKFLQSLISKVQKQTVKKAGTPPKIKADIKIRKK